MEYASSIELGSVPHVIEAKNKKALASKTTLFGKRVFHPGYRGDSFLYWAYKNVDVTKSTADDMRDMTKFIEIKFKTNSLRIPKLVELAGRQVFTKMPKERTFPYIFLSDFYQKESGPKDSYQYDVELLIQIRHILGLSLKPLLDDMDNVIRHDN